MAPYNLINVAATRHKAAHITFRCSKHPNAAIIRPHIIPLLWLFEMQVSNSLNKNHNSRLCVFDLERVTA
jgi:hypothetical protein